VLDPLTAETRDHGRKVGRLSGKIATSAAALSSNSSRRSALPDHAVNPAHGDVDLGNASGLIDGGGDFFDQRGLCASISLSRASASAALRPARAKLRRKILPGDCLARGAVPRRARPPSRPPGPSCGQARDRAADQGWRRYRSPRTGAEVEPLDPAAGRPELSQALACCSCTSYSGGGTSEQPNLWPDEVSGRIFYASISSGSSSPARFWMNMKRSAGSRPMRRSTRSFTAARPSYVLRQGDPDQACGWRGSSWLRAIAPGFISPRPLKRPTSTFLPLNFVASSSARCASSLAA